MFLSVRLELDLASSRGGENHSIFGFPLIRTRGEHAVPVWFPAGGLLWAGQGAQHPTGLLRTTALLAEPSPGTRCGMNTPALRSSLIKAPEPPLQSLPCCHRQRYPERDSYPEAGKRLWLHKLYFPRRQIN